MAVRHAVWLPRRQGQFVPRALVLASLALFGAISSARAEEGDAFQVQTSVNMTHDDNLFLLPNPSVAPPGSSGDGSTWMQTETADFMFDHRYSAQIFHADVSVNRYTFDSLHYLDYNAVNYDAQWQWQLSDHLGGTLSVDHERFLDSYDDFHDYNTPNLSSHTAQTFKFDWDASGPWHLVGGLLHANVSSPTAFTEVGTFGQTDVQLGLSYVSPLGNSITFQLRDSVGTFDRALDPVDVLDNGYKQREAETLTHMMLGGWTSLDTRVGYVDRRYDNFAQRDYQGWVGRLQLNWQPSAHTSLNLAASRNLVSFESNDSSYYWVEQLSVGSAWDITSKIRLAGSANISWRTFDGAIENTGDSGARSDHILGARLELDYKPTPKSSISLYVSSSQQNANMEDTAYKDRTFGITATLRF